MIRKILSLSIFVMLITLPMTAFAYDDDSVIIDRDEDGYYYETIIEYAPESIASVGLNTAKSTRTGTKTVNYRNSAGDIMWYVKVSGKFTYGNGSSSCTSSSVTAASKDSNWTITGKSASKSGSKAKASATANHTKGGEVITKTVTLTCSSSGKLS